MERLVWTCTLPTIKGWYEQRHPATRRYVHLVEVKLRRGVLRIYVYGRISEDPLSEWLEWEWYGPMQRPEWA